MCTRVSVKAEPRLRLGSVTLRAVGSWSAHLTLATVFA
jgi:hypothetical protein